ncbi:hypothetical protein FX983_06552 [Pseudomonas frederiksbergensis]|uniref:Uncharacterized protein n=1 Tax=Pseudomonas frederiksbergensis TaxID=104087 RepID=A0A6L5BMW4_9PSED|nr:hypothetical protein FX983_06552 [Pseudomonas frederiksbergensis]
MPEQGRELRVGRLDPGARTLCAHAHTQRQGVDEHAQRAISALAALHPPHQYGAEHHLFAARHPTDDLRPGQMHQARRTHAKLPRLHSQTHGQRRIDHLMLFFNPTAIALHILQTERQRRLVDIAEHVAEERFVLLTAHAQSGLRHMITVRHGGAELLRLAQQMGLHFMHHHFKRGVVQRHVVEQQHADPAVIRRVLRIGQPHQRSLGNIQSIVTRVETLVQLLHHIPRCRIGRDFLNHHLRPTPDHLHRRGQPLPDHAGAQDIVTRHHALQGLGKRIHAVTAVKTEQHLQHVRITLGRGEVVIQDPFLQRCQRVDVLHVGDATRYGGDDAVDGLLIEVGQRQHVRGDALAILGNPIRRHQHFGLIAHGRGQRGQRWLAKEDANVSGEINLAHTLDELHGQQRMSAQFKEIVMPADLLDLQQVLPDSGDGAFDLALRGDVFATRVGH